MDGPSLRIDIIEFSRGYQGVHRCCALTTAVGTGERPCSAPDCNSVQRPLGSLVGKASSRKGVKAVAREERPAEIGQHEEFLPTWPQHAASMTASCRPLDIGKIAEPGIRIGLEDSGMAGEISKLVPGK
jgi:hypothetical protein